jgi:hypothetical protein
LPVALDDHVESLDALVLLVEGLAHGSFVFDELFLVFPFELLYSVLEVAL